MTQDFSVVERTSMEGTATFYVIDAGQGDKPVAEFGDRDAAQAKASELNARDAARDEPDDAKDGPKHTNP